MERWRGWRGQRTGRRGRRRTFRRIRLELYPTVLLLCAFIEYQITYLCSTLESFETWCLVKSYGSQGRGNSLSLKCFINSSLRFRAISIFSLLFVM